MARRGTALELAVLGLLHETPMHGYELRKRLNIVLGWGRLLSYGTLYPCLKGLGRRGLIATVDDPDPALRGRRSRIVYQLTPEGKEHFATMLEDAGPSTWDDENFDVRFAFFGRVAASTRVRILEGRRSRLEERLENVRAATQARRERVDSYTLELQRHGLESVEREINWLTDLIERERASETESGSPADGKSEPGPISGTASGTTAHQSNEQKDE